MPALSSNAANAEKVISIYGKEGESISTACKKILEVVLSEENAALKLNACSHSALLHYCAVLCWFETYVALLLIASQNFAELLYQN